MISRAIPIAATLLRCHRWLLWGAAAVVAVMVVIGLTYAATGILDGSMWESAGQAARWMLFATGAMTTPLFLRPYVALGVSRRAFAAASGLVGLVLVAAGVVYLAAGLLVERAIFAAAGEPYGFASEHRFTSVGQVHLVATEYAPLFAAYLASGWIIGSAFYRFGGWRGLLAIPPGLGPVVAVENLLGTGQWTGLGPPALGAAGPVLPLPVAAGLALAVVGITLAAGHALTRTIPIRTRSQP